MARQVKKKHDAIVEDAFIDESVVTETVLDETVVEAPVLDETVVEAPKHSKITGNTQQEVQIAIRKLFA